MGPQVLMGLKEPKALQAYLALKDSKEQQELQAVLVTQAPLDQKAPLEMLDLLGPQEKLEIQVMQKCLLPNKHYFEVNVSLHFLVMGIGKIA